MVFGFCLQRLSYHTLHSDRDDILNHHECLHGKDAAKAFSIDYESIDCEYIDQDRKALNTQFLVLFLYACSNCVSWLFAWL